MAGVEAMVEGLFTMIASMDASAQCKIVTLLEMKLAQLRIDIQMHIGQSSHNTEEDDLHVGTSHGNTQLHDPTDDTSHIDIKQEHEEDFDISQEHNLTDTPGEDGLKIEYNPDDDEHSGDNDNNGGGQDDDYDDGSGQDDDDDDADDVRGQVDDDAGGPDDGGQDDDDGFNNCGDADFTKALHIEQSRSAIAMGGKGKKKNEKPALDEQECAACQLKMPSSQLHSHLADVHNITGSRTVPSKNATKTTCIAPKKKTVNPESPYTCDLCGKIFSSMVGFKDHKASQHGEGKIVHCTWPGCSKRFYRQSRMLAHLVCHTQERPAICERCGNKYSSKYHLNSHLKKDNCRFKKFRIACISCTYENCEKKFQTNRGLADHMTSMHENVVYKCPIDGCGAEFRWRHQRGRHLRKFHQADSVREENK